MDDLLQDRLWERFIAEAQQALSLGQIDKAVESFQAAVKVSEQFADDDHRKIRGLTGLGLAYSMRKDFAMAEPVLEKSLALTRQASGQMNPACVGLLKHLAVASLNQKKYDTARSYYDEAIALHEQSNPHHPDLPVLREQQQKVLRAQQIEKRKTTGELTVGNMEIVKPLKHVAGPRDTIPSIVIRDRKEREQEREREREEEERQDEGTGVEGIVIDNRYEVLGQIGEGAMSTIYKGQHLVLEREVAIKVVQKRALSDAKDRARFQQEAKLLSKLDHKNIIAIFDFGETKSFFYLIMDFIRGESLSKRIKSGGKIAVPECLQILVQLCDGLEHAHSKGILHRDLKPSNVMLIKTEQDPMLVKLIDFGIAKAFDSAGESLHLTRTGETVGSPLYMSPEQCRGEELDNRSDIYSLGCLAYTALTGVEPFTGKNHIEVYVKHTNVMPLTFSEACPGLSVDPRLEEAVFKALAKDPQHRYLSMFEFKSALTGLM